MTASTLTPADARAVLDQIDGGALDVLPAAARAALCAEADRALHALTIAVVVEVRPATRSGGRTVVVACPLCLNRHRHGYPFGDPEPGWRSAHCGSGRSYFIPAPSNAVESVGNVLNSADNVAGGGPAQLRRSGR